MTVSLRPMNHKDTEAACLMAGISLSETAEEKREVHNRSVVDLEQRHERYRLALERDPGGAWVAEDGERIVGVALALKREGVWILSLLAVDEDYRDAGVGRGLLDLALDYSAGCAGAMIASSTHPAAMRRYARAGFTLHPTLMASGEVREASIPPRDLPVRDGGAKDLALAARVDRLVRGAAHGPDLAHMLDTGAGLLVSESPAGRGYAVEWKGSPALVAATEPEVAAKLLWACLSRAKGEVEVRWITSAQNWAIPVVLDAGLALSPAGPICTRGRLGPLTPYLLSGPFL